MDQLNVLKQALEALEKSLYPQKKQFEAITALRQAIQEQALQNLTDFDQQAEHGALIHEGTKQEPVAWMHIKTGVLRLDDRVKGADFEPSHWTPLYTAAPPPRKEKQAQPEEGEYIEVTARWGKRFVEMPHPILGGDNIARFYFDPTPRQPLTDEEIDRVTDAQWASNNNKPIYAAHRAYARAIEAAHGIKENT